MKIKNIAFITIAAVTLSFSSCSSSDSNASAEGASTDTVGVEEADYDFGAQKYSKAQMDSLTNHPDDMSANEAAGALVYLYNSVQNSTGNRHLVAKRKFMDFYNIVLENHGDDLRSSIKKVNKSQGIDLAKIYEEYAAVMSSGDEGGATISDIKVDTIRTIMDNITSVTTVISEDVKIASE